MTDSTLISFLKYYRNSLADGERLDVSKKDYENGFFFNSINELEKKKLIKTYEELYKTIPKKNNQEQKEEEREPINVFISPFFITNEYKHSVQNMNRQKVYPFWMPCVLTVEGRLLPPIEENVFPWFVRSVLEPTNFKSSDFPIISTIAKVDSVLNFFKWSFDCWTEYIENSEIFFKEVTGFSFTSFKIDGFIKNSRTCIIKAKDIVPAFNVIKLYDSIIENSHKSSLVESLLGTDTISRIAIPESSDFFLEKGHYGQYGNQFSLSTSQRKSILAFEQQTTGKTLAVNGPPGTGKTTLLQSIVANELVKSVINGEKPPRLVASSTNNQAITNILDSFGTSDDVVSWMPKLSSLGIYMISSSTKKQEESIKKGYQLLMRSGNKLDGKYFTDFHLANFENIEDFFLSKQDVIDRKNISIEDIISVLKNKVIETTQTIDKYLEITKQANWTENEYYSFDELPVKMDEIENLIKKLKNKKNEFNELILFRDNFENFISKNRLLYILSFIPYFNNILVSKIRLFLANAPFDSIKELTNQQKIRNELIIEIDRIRNLIKEIENPITLKTKVYNEVLNIKISWDVVSKQLTEKWNKYLLSLALNINETVKKEYNRVDRAEKVNMILDISLRYEAFVYSKYYWEGKWIEKRKLDKRKPNEWMPRQEMLEYISYLTPLFISTFHTLPSYSSYEKGSSGNKVFVPLYDFFDLLIVDEAGQVSPEIAVPSFSLAKKALVVGDVSQIEPIWNIAYESIDKGNLVEAKLLEDATFSELKNKGMLCSSGSLMKLAQNASYYATSKTLNGTFLSEHRRCVDEIVAFSNKYVYDNLLIPKVGSSKGQEYENRTGEKILIPPLSYINISGKSETKNSSNYNTLEAVAIAKWISKYKEHILTITNKGEQKENIKGLKDIIGIVTPFAAQRNEIIKQFRKYEIDTEITVGTVHALQGAEREIVIFSPTYGTNHTGNMFFDSGYNMLNVALTRAKKHFLVIGNMRLFNPMIKNKPSGGLANFLFLRQENELSSSFFYESSNKNENSNRINKLSKHVEALKKAFDIAEKQLIIVSPFLSINAINSDNLIDNIKGAVNRGIKVEVFTDKNLDSINGKLKDNAKEARELLINNGIKLTILNGIHNKAIAIDDKVLIEGSFNWLSAVRDENSLFSRYEVSQVIKGVEALKQINQLVSDLDKIPN